MRSSGAQSPKFLMRNPVENFVRTKTPVSGQVRSQHADGDLYPHYQDGVGGATSGYDAFISYSHALDGALAPTLQTGLERFAKPWYRSRALRVFRPTTSLSANPDLWASIEEALASSAWLVLMASTSTDRIVRLWTMDVDQAIQRICATTSNILTRTKWERYVSKDLPYSPPCQSNQGASPTMPRR